MLVSLKVVIVTHCQVSQKEGKSLLHIFNYYMYNREFSKKLKERVDDYFTANNIVSTVESMAD